MDKANTGEAPSGQQHSGPMSQTTQYPKSANTT